MCKHDITTFKALYAPFSHKKRKSWSDGYVSFQPAKSIVILTDSDDSELVRCKLTSTWRPQSGQTDVTVFEGYICEIYEDVNGSSAQEDTVEVLPTKKASRGLLRAELPLRPTKLPVRTAPREHHTDASNSHPDPPHPSGIGVSKEQAKPVSSHSAPFAGCAAQQCMNERKGYRSDADVLAQFAKIISQMATNG